jgi:hypothetical protein
MHKLRKEEKEAVGKKLAMLLGINQNVATGKFRADNRFITALELFEIVHEVCCCTPHKEEK